MNEQDMALDILFCKDVDLVQLAIAYTVEEYNSQMSWSCTHLTRDEFNLLKRISKKYDRYHDVYISEDLE